MVLGGVVVLQDKIKIVENAVKEFRQKHNFHSEFKWSKISNQRYKVYRDFLELFFAFNDLGILKFHAIILDTHLINHKRFSGGDYEIGFYKFYYQLLLHPFGKRYYEEGVRYIAHLDYRTSNYPLQQLRTILNNGLSSKYKMHGRPFVAVEPRDSATTEFIQMADIILGAIGYEKNGFTMLLDSKKAKVDLVQYICQRIGIGNLCDDTGFRRDDFTLWNMRLKK